MGWFWADAPAAVALSTTELVAPHPLPSQKGASPPAGCPMHKRTIDVLSSAAPSSPKSSGCPVPHNGSGSPLPPSSCLVPHDQRTPAESSSSVLSKLNPLNYMFHNISQSRAPNQTFALPLEREPSTIPKGDTSGENWEYPSPQQMYNALLRKGYTDTDVTAVESMVAVHNFLNEGAWAEIVEWERRFGRGLSRGWKACSRGEEHSAETVKLLELSEGSAVEPKLVRFQGRPKDMTPKAAVVQAMGKVWPSKFGTEPPFDRHDWYVARDFNGTTKQVRYVIDYYSGPPEPTGEPVFYLDVRPAMTPSGAAERLVRWGSDVWWRASGGEVREKGPQQ